MIYIIAAVARNLAIGKDGALPWRLPEDLARFKALTSGNIVIMGRRTLESIGAALPGRDNVVISSRPCPAVRHTAADWESALAIARQLPGCSERKIFAIGGAEVYRAALPDADYLHLTEVECEVEDADTFFPAFDRREWVAETAVRRPPKDGAPGFSFVDYRRKTPGAARGS